MRAGDRKPLYRHMDVALLRAAAAPLTAAAEWWPDLTDTDACRRWLEEVWTRTDLADAVRQASPSLGEGVDAIRAGRAVGDKRIRGATRSTARYLLRSIGRPTPFGLFAGVAPVSLGGTAQADWGGGHRGVARVDTGWLADVIARLQRCTELLERLDVVVTDLAVRRGGRLEVPQGPNRVTIRYTRAVAVVHRLAAAPVRFGALVDALAGDFSVDRSTVRGMFTELVRQVLSYLVHLVEPVTVDGQRLPGWWTAHSPGDQSSTAWPGGHSNLGLAHGIAGPLALLAIATRLGVTVSGHAEAIDRICAELDQWCCGTTGRCWWPGVISPAEWKTRSVRQPGPQRPSWCYGTPGLARAQQLAALALGDRRRQRQAEDALAGCITDDEQLAQLGDACVCHGWAGLVQATRRAAADAGPDRALAAVLPHLHTCFEQQLHSRRLPIGDGLLEGATGIALTRHTTADTPSTLRWDACLLLAPPTNQASPSLETPHTDGDG